MLRTAHNNKYNKSKTVFTSTCDRDAIEKKSGGRGHQEIVYDVIGDLFIVPRFNMMQYSCKQTK